MISTLGRDWLQEGKLLLQYDHSYWRCSKDYRWIEDEDMGRYFYVDPGDTFWIPTDQAEDFLRHKLIPAWGKKGIPDDSDLKVVINQDEELVFERVVRNKSKLKCKLARCFSAPAPQRKIGQGPWQDWLVWVCPRCGSIVKKKKKKKGHLYGKKDRKNLYPETLSSEIKPISFKLGTLIREIIAETDWTKEKNTESRNPENEAG